MRARPSRHWLTTAFLAALILAFGLDAMAAPESTNLSDLPLASQAQISAALGRDHASYHALARDEGFRVENRKHGLVTDFATSGIRVRVGTAMWRLALRGYGYGDELQPVTAVAPQAVANRVEYPRGVGHGGSCTGSVHVKVLKGWAHPIDDGQKYDSTRP